MNRFAFLLLLPALALAEDAKPRADVEARGYCDEAKNKHGKVARELYDKAIAADPSCADAWAGRGITRMYEEPSLALADLARADALKDTFQPATAWARINILYFVYLDRTAAWSEAELLKRKASGAWAFAGAGFQKLMTGQSTFAEEDFDHAAKSGSDAPWLWTWKALAQSEYGSLRAADAARDANREDPDCASTQAVAALVRGLEDPVAGAAELDRVAAAAPKLAWAHVAKAKTLLRASLATAKWPEVLKALSGDADAANKALAALAAADAASPAGPETAYLRGIANVLLGKGVEAEAALTNAVTWDTNYVEGFWKRGDVRARIHDYAGALRDYDSLKGFGMEDNEKKTLTDKIDLAQHAKERDDCPVVSYKGFCDRAKSYIEDSDFERAEKDIAAAKELDPKLDRTRQLQVFLQAKKRDMEKLGEALQAVADAGGEGMIQFYSRNLDGGPFLGDLRKDPALATALRKFTPKKPRDAYLRAQAFYEFAMGTGQDPKTTLYATDKAKAVPYLKEAAGEFEKMTAAFKDAEQVPGAYYNEACSWSLAGETDKAFAALDKSIEAGYGKGPNEIKHMEEEDTDFTDIKKDPRWAEAVKKIKAKWGGK